jgi:hypothetical protein
MISLGPARRHQGFDYRSVALGISAVILAAFEIGREW